MKKLIVVLLTCIIATCLLLPAIAETIYIELPNLSASIQFPEHWEYITREKLEKQGKYYQEELDSMIASNLVFMGNYLQEEQETPNIYDSIVLAIEATNNKFAYTDVPYETLIEVGKSMEKQGNVTFLQVYESSNSLPFILWHLNTDNGKEGYYAYSKVPDYDIIFNYTFDSSESKQLFETDVVSILQSFTLHQKEEFGNP